MQDLKKFVSRLCSIARSHLRKVRPIPSTAGLANHGSDRVLRAGTRVQLHAVLVHEETDEAAYGIAVHHAFGEALVVLVNVQNIRIWWGRRLRPLFFETRRQCTSTRGCASFLAASVRLHSGEGRQVERGTRGSPLVKSAGRFWEVGATGAENKAGGTRVMDGSRVVWVADVFGGAIVPTLPPEAPTTKCPRAARLTKGHQVCHMIRQSGNYMTEYRTCRELISNRHIEFLCLKNGLWSICYLDTI